MNQTQTKLSHCDQLLAATHIELSMVAQMNALQQDSYSTVDVMRMLLKSVEILKAKQANELKAESEVSA